MRDTSANFSTYGFSALQDFQKSLVRQQAELAKEYYHATGYIQCSRMLSEMGMGWTTPDEAEDFKTGMDVIGCYADGIDSTMQHVWRDDMFLNVWKKYAAEFPQLPKFRVRTDVVGESGKLPNRTGVSVPQDAPYGSLQFGWIGNKDGRLFDCATFNALGLEAVQLVDRDALWGNDPRLLALVKQPRYFTDFKARKRKRIDEKQYLNDTEYASIFVSTDGIVNRLCKWYFIKLIEGE